MKNTLRKFLRKLWRDDRGSAAIEYALIAALVSVATLPALVNLQANLVGVFTTIGSALSGL